MLEEIIAAVKEKFSDRDVKIFVERFGFITHKPRTLLSLAEEFGIEREDVRKSEEKVYSYLNKKFQDRKTELQEFWDSWQKDYESWKMDKGDSNGN